MYMVIKFNDDTKTFSKRVKDEGEILREKKKFEGDYKIRQVANVNSGTGYIFLAEKKPKYIWD